MTERRLLYCQRIAVIATCCVVAGYELYLTNFGYDTALCVLVAAGIAACGTAMALTPVVGAAATLAASTLAALMQIPLPLPIALMLIPAGAMLVQRAMVPGIVMTTVAATAGICDAQTVTHGMGGVDRIPVYAAAALIAICAGFVLRAWQAQHEQRVQAAETSRRHRMARTLHDQVANDINDVIMMLDHVCDEQDTHAGAIDHAQLERVRSTARHALSGVREVILELEDDRGAASPTALPHRHNEHARHTQSHANLYEQAREYHERLLAMGFQGELLILGDDEPTGAHMALADDALHEVFGDISKYADSGQRYCVMLSCTPTHIGIGVTDTVRDADEVEHGLGTGLPGLRERITDCGGTMDVELNGVYWNLQTSIPRD